MKALALLIALSLGIAGIAPAGELTNAAKGAKSKRSKSTSKVITNTDVKKSKGKVGTTGAPSTPVEREPTLLEKQATSRAAEKVASEQRLACEKRIADLEKDLAATEQAYYGENDLNRRDTVLVRRFNDIKTKLDAARAELAALGDGSSAEPETSHPRPANDSE
jgi:hypothetical protein